MILIMPYAIQAMEDPDERAFMEQLYIRYNRLIYSEVRKCLNNRWEAEDVLQIVVIRLIGHVATMRTLDRDHLVNYLIRAARNTVYNYNRDHHKEAAFSFDESFDSLEENRPSLDEQLALVERREDAAAAWAKLDERSRYLLEAKYFLEKDNEELAEELGISPAGVRMALSRARAKMREYMMEEEKS